ncbi:toMV resistance protein Tm-2(2)-like [Coffea arabica]|uniref:ToMV resistance protein Tm-2(2)-like n=1 Tax=Coffea arabica TaxID=13443 RepID=A0A6P6SU66_COFAR|nr:disease resistance RPP8-like protein 3 [Coffea arabica]
MAEIVLTAVINKAIEVISNLITEGSSGLHWLEEDIRWIERETRHVWSYLDEAEARQDENHLVRNLVQDIEDLAHDIEDILDTLLPWLASRKSKGHLGCLTAASHVFSCGNDTAQHFVGEIEKIKRKIEDIDRLRTTYGIVDRGGTRSGDTWDPRRSFLYADESEIVGLEQDSDNLETRLLDTDLENGVISIVGMPGIGKTTLGKEIYRRVRHHFDCSAQVYVSQEPSIRELLLDIARQVGLEKGKFEDPIEANLGEYLRGKRFLVFLDDVWNTRTWDCLKLGFPNKPMSGSRIIITSRNTGVGRYIGGESSLHLLQPLTPENSWKLFSKMVMISRGRNAVDLQGFEYIGKKIVEKCGGIPLAIVVTAGMLRERERTVHAWNGVLKSMSQDDHGELSKVLATSYKDLPSTLKPCFLYFGLFPEDHEIPAFQLINMWAAEKFIIASGEQDVEDVAEDYLNNLVARNLIQVASRRFDGRIRSCRIHDLLHNLSISIAKQTNFFRSISGGDKHSNTDSSSSRGRRITYNPSNTREPDHFGANYEILKVRAMLCFDTNQYLQEEDFVVSHQLGGLTFLRVLSVETNSFLSSVPDEIGNLRLLSYIGLRGYYRGSLPSSIRNLKNLTTLDLRECRGICLPTCIWNMKKLKFFLLHESATFTTSRRLKNEVSLSSLRILDVVNCRHLEPHWLHKFTSLRKLGIRYPSTKISEILSGAGPILTKLENLRLTGSYPPTGKLNLYRYESLIKLHLGIVIEKLPDVKEFPRNLTKLSLRFTELEEDPFYTLKKLPRLEILKLGHRSYVSKELVCSGADSFPQLRVLKLRQLYDLENLLAEDGAMQELKTITIRDCWKLKVSKRFLSRTIIER